MLYSRNFIRVWYNSIQPTCTNFLSVVQNQTSKRYFKRSSLENFDTNAMGFEREENYDEANFQKGKLMKPEKGQVSGVSLKIANCLAGACLITLEDATKLFNDYSDIFLHVGLNKMHERLNIFYGCGLSSGHEIFDIIDNHPEVLYEGETTRMHETATKLLNFFSQKERRKMLTRTPHILLNRFEELEMKYEYIFFHMGMEAAELLCSEKWFEKSLDEIMMRHQFLEKTGNYKLPDPKRPQLKKDNPTLDKILDTEEDLFAKNIGGVSIEEWNIFKAFADKQKSLEGQAKPYERIKPSKRKAYERRRKESKEKEDFIFEEENGSVQTKY